MSSRRYQEAGVHLEVIQERQPAPRKSFAGHQGEEQERQPGEEGDADDAPLHQFERRSGEPRTHQKLEQGPSQNEREIRRFIRPKHAVLFVRAFHGLSLQFQISSRP
jgi:hypothetical protein